MSESTLRVLGFAMRTLPALPTDDGGKRGILHDLRGRSGNDRPAPPGSGAIRARLPQAGIRTIMITGDHKVTALAIARELGIYQEGDAAVSGDTLDSLSGRRNWIKL